MTSTDGADRDCGRTGNRKETHAPEHMVATGSGERPDDGRRRRDGKTVAVDVLITIGIATALFAIGSQKSGFFLDEVCTLMFSNHDYDAGSACVFTVEDGMVYDGGDLWEECTAVSEGGAFDYANVWENQAADVHPPLYYVFVHTVSSLFPGLPAVWTCLLVSVPIACVVYWQLVWMCGHLGMRRWMARTIPATFVLGAGFVNYAVVLFRMYGLFTVWVNALLMVFMRHEPGRAGSIEYYVTFGLSLLGGALTQYYFLVYALLACLVYAIAVAVARNWRKLLASLGTAAVSLGAAVLIFPASIHHIFGSSRGEEAFQNASSTEGLLEALEEYLQLIDEDLFGGLVLVVAAAIAVLAAAVAAYRAYGKNHGGDTTETKPTGEAEGTSGDVLNYCLLIVPSLAYIVFVAQIAPYHSMRYIIAACASLYLAAFGAMGHLASKLPRRNLACACVGALAAVILASGYRDGLQDSLHFLFLDEAPKTDFIEAHDDSVGIVLYEESYSYNIEEYLYELSAMDSVVFLDADSWEGFDYAGLGSSSLMIVVDTKFEVDGDDALSAIMEDIGASTCEECFDVTRGTLYYLH